MDSTSNTITDEGVEIDLGHLTATDIDFHLNTEGGIPNEHELLNRTQQCVIKIFSQLSNLPHERDNHLSVVNLPEPKTRLPRAQSLPQPKPLTRWERYAKEKGIHNKKRSRMVWDEGSQEWKPRWGYQRAGNKPEDQWLVEIPDQKDPYEDYFEKAKDKKRERVAKNEYHRVKNLMRDHEGKIKAPHLLTDQQQRGSRKELQKMAGLARVSTPSLGRFSENVKGEPKSIRGEKRKFDPVLGDLNAERDKQLKLLDSMSRDKPVVNVGKAVNRYIDKKQKSRKDKVTDSDNDDVSNKRGKGKFGRKPTGRTPKSKPLKSTKKVQKKLKRLQQTKKRMRL